MQLPFWSRLGRMGEVMLIPSFQKETGMYREFAFQHHVVISVDSNECQEPKPVPIHSSSAFHYIRIYFNAFYFMGFSPYRFQYNPVTNSYHILEPTTFRKAVSIVLQALTLLLSVTHYRSMVPKLKFKDNPTEIFSVFNGFAFIFFYIPGLMYMIWRKMGNLLVVLNISSRDKPRENGCMKETCIAYLGIVVSAVGAILVTNLNQYASAPVLEDSVVGRMKAVAGLMGYNFYLREHREALGPTESFPPALAALAVAHWLIAQYFAMLCFIFESLPTFASLVIYGISKDFSKMLETSSGIPREKVLEEYVVFKELVRNLNVLLSAAIIVNFVAALPYYPILLISIVDGEEQISIIMVIVMFGSILTAAEANRRFAEFSHWLLRTGDGGLVDKSGTHLTMLFIESTASPLGLKAGGLFTISYNFVGAGLSALATYIFIGLQFTSKSPLTSVASLNN